jgi:glutamyl-tRNA reductase
VVLQLVHQSPGRTAFHPETAVWRTCLREVAFVGDTTAQADPARAVIADGDAYSLLVEIVSGLRSPLVGETEVQAQFKAFLASLDPDRHGAVRRLGQRILRDAKRIRHEHLQGFGAHSYGRLATARVQEGAHVVLLGTGALAAEISSALPAAISIDQWGRTTKGVAHQKSSVEGFGARRFFLYAAPEDLGLITPQATTIIVAAPVSPRDLNRVLACYPNQTRVIDLRPAIDRTPVGQCGDIVTLDDLFSDARAAADPVIADRVDAARAEIRRLGADYAHQEELRPFGWDDLCA